MKQTILSYFLLLALFNSLTGKASDHVTLSLENATSTLNTIEFDVTIINDGTTSLNLRGYQFGINFNTSIMNGATLDTFKYLTGTRDAVFNGLSNNTAGFANLQLRNSSNPVANSSSVILPIGTTYSLGRFKFTNTVNWLIPSTPNLQFQLAAQTGKFHCIVFVYNPTTQLQSTLTNAAGTVNGVSNIGSLAFTAPLPVKLSSFSGTKSGPSDLLTWTTSQEQNNQYFNVQHSRDGIAFNTIDRVYSMAQDGNSKNELTYSIENEQPNVGHNYYRLEQVDIDGHATIETKIIDLERSSESASVKVSPNPAASFVTIHYISEKAQRVSCQLLNMNGKIIRSSSFTSSAGENEIAFDLKEIASGNYIVQFMENNKVISIEKIVKIN